MNFMSKILPIDELNERNESTRGQNYTYDQLLQAGGLQNINMKLIMASRECSHSLIRKRG